MKAIWKRAFSLFLALALCLSFFPAALAEEVEEGQISLTEPVDPTGEGTIQPADAPDALSPSGDVPNGSTYSGSCGDDLTWTLDADGLLTISGTGDMTDFDFDNDTPWSGYRSSIKEILLEPGVTSIGNVAFYDCENLTEVTIPASVSKIGILAFDMCQILPSITIPEGVTTIGADAFSYCSSLESVTIPASVTFIGQAAFSLPTNAFSSCNKLTAIEVSPDNPSFRSIDGVLFSKDGKRIVAFPGGLGGTYVIPAGVTDVGEASFEGCSKLTGVTFPTGVTCINDRAFSFCSDLTSVSIPAGVTNLGDMAFSCCFKLTSASIPDTVSRIGNQAFCACSHLTDVFIPASMASIGGGVFAGCWSLTAIKVAPDNAAFQSIDDVLFSKDGKQLYSYPGARSGHYLIPDTVTEICDAAFGQCFLLSEVTIPSSVTNIGDQAFSLCTGLKQVTIPASVTSIGWQAFDQCSQLTDIWFQGAAPSFDWDVFSRVTATVHYPANDPSWTDEVRQDYGGSLTWVAESTGPEIIASGVCGDDLTWTLDTDGLLTVSGTGDMADYNPDNNITPWNSYLSSIKEILLEPGVTSIGDTAFNRCTNLTKVTIPASVSKIGTLAFGSCQILPSITIPEGVTTISADAFYHCDCLESVTIPASVTFIGYAELSLPTNAFSSCSKLTAIEVSPDNPSFRSVNGVLFSKDGKRIVAFPGGLGGTYAIPAGVVDVGEASFDGCSKLTGVTIPTGVTCISKRALSFCRNLTSVSIPAGVTSLGDMALSCCFNLTSVSIPDTVTSLGSQVFYGCTKLTDVFIPASVTSIGNGVFGDCLSLTAIKVASDNAAFQSIDGVLFSRDGKKLYSYPGARSGQYLIPNTVTEICGYGFDHCYSLSEVTIPSSVTSIGEDAFFRCTGLKQVMIPASVSSIGWQAFAYCSQLTDIWFQGATPSFDWDVFSQVTATVHYPANDPSWTDEIRQDYGGTLTWMAESTGPDIIASGVCGDDLTWTLDTDGLLTISGSGMMYDYDLQSPSPWAEKQRSIVRVILEPGVADIGDWAFNSCGYMTRVMIPDSVTEIGNDAFSFCSNLGSVTIPEGVTSIGENAFFWCNSLSTVVIPASVTRLGGNLFGSCKNLMAIQVAVENPAYCSVDGILYDKQLQTLICCPCGKSGIVAVPDGVAEIGAAAFEGCKDLTSVTLPDSLASIESYAFYNCSGLMSLDLPQSTTFFGGYAFYGCSGLTSITIPEGTISIANYTFYNCINLASITLPNSLWGIGNYAFQYCDSLTSVTIPAHVNSVGYKAFADCQSLNEIYFRYIAPDFAPNCFTNTSATVYYPDNDSSWTEQIRQNYGGAITWEAYTVIPEIVYSGACGDNVFWTLDEQGLLTITGEGEMPDYESSSSPWYAFKHQINTIDIQEGVSRIGSNAFMECFYVSSVLIPDSVSEIGAWAFQDCDRLQSIVIPAGVKAIEDAALGSCDGMLSIMVSGENPSFISVDGVLYSADGQTLLACPAGKSGYFAVPEQVTDVRPWAFCGCYLLTGISLPPDGISYLGEGLFWRCYSLRSFQIPSTVERIESSAFFECTSLADVQIPDGVVSIGNNAFYGCTSLKELSLPASLTTLGYYAFFHCTELSSVTLPASLTSIAQAPFANCSSLKEILTSEDNPSYKSLDGILFSKDGTKLHSYPCAKEGNYCIPLGVEVICYGAFYGCGSVSSVMIPKSLMQIENAAFCDCAVLSSVIFTGPAPSFTQYSFTGADISVFYPANDPSWTDAVRQSYGGNITWLPRTPGDVDNSGEVEASDLLHLRSFLVETDEDIVVPNADVNADGNVDILDLIRMRKYLARDDVILE